MTVTIYHNPQCSNSRRALEVIRQSGIEPVIVEYLKSDGVLLIECFRDICQVTVFVNKSKAL